MDNNTTVNVNVDPSNSFASPAPVLTLIFATLCFCFWANTMGFFTEGTVLAIGVLQLGVFVAYTVGGVFLLVMVPGVRYACKCDFLMFLFGGLGVLGYGLTGAGLAPAWLNYPAAFCLLIDGLAGMWQVFSIMLGWCGIELTQGKPFFTPK